VLEEILKQIDGQ
jgi:hypothetical protein